MKIFCTLEFIEEVKKLLKNKSHSDCENALIENLFTNTIDEIKSIGVRKLGGKPQTPFLRKRIAYSGTGKSKGFRLYFWLFVVNENIYLLFIHPKYGKYSTSNITTQKQIQLVETFKEYQKEQKFDELYLNKETLKICYSKNSENVF